MVDEEAFGGCGDILAIACYTSQSAEDLEKEVLNFKGKCFAARICTLRVYLVSEVEAEVEVESLGNALPRLTPKETKTK